MFKFINKISFPTPSGININMMPIIVGDENSLPGLTKLYNDIINSCSLKIGSKAYLSISESQLNPGQFQRRPGIHTQMEQMILGVAEVGAENLLTKEFILHLLMEDVICGMI